MAQVHTSDGHRTNDYGDSDIMNGAVSRPMVWDGGGGASNVLSKCFHL